MKCDSLSNLVSTTGKQIFLVAESIRSAYNVGAMFRTADGTGEAAIILTGYSPTPENPKVAKTALGAEHAVPWISIPRIESVVDYGREHHIFQTGLELTSRSESLFTAQMAFPLFLYVGNEVTGLSLYLMTELEHFSLLPMRGVKASLNVAEATSVALYELAKRLW